MRFGSFASPCCRHMLLQLFALALLPAQASDPNPNGMFRQDGRLVEENEAGKLIETPQQPYTRMLMDSTPRFTGAG